MHALDKVIRSQRKQILEGLDLNKATASAAIKEDAQLGYEIVREIAFLVRNDRIRLQQIVLLQSFSLRSDMELELEPPPLDEFDPDLAAYIGEIAKIKRELINSKAIRYLLAHEADILRMEHGRQIMIDAAGAAVRKKNISIPSLILLVAMRTDFRDIASSACIRSYAAIPACRGTACGTGCRPFIMNTTARTLIFKNGIRGAIPL